MGGMIEKRHSSNNERHAKEKQCDQVFTTSTVESQGGRWGHPPSPRQLLVLISVPFFYIPQLPIIKKSSIKRPPNQWHIHEWQSFLCHVSRPCPTLEDRQFHKGNVLAKAKSNRCGTRLTTFRNENGISNMSILRRFVFSFFVPSVPKTWIVYISGYD